ncbi:unnamed protein product [Blepharisma stoltei]|uniref:Uncharacterized protein n=1 Tax=Blepharisma stoltei TaxID=1481888 RepID=A0AAU9J2T3_9CILI|nr:unnamed protein product [Blepharisma stoltei]
MMLFKQHRPEEADEESFASIISISNNSPDELLKINQSCVEVSFYSVINFYQDEDETNPETIKQTPPPIGKAHCCKCSIF